MPFKKITFVVNPHSANGLTGKEWPHIRARAKDRLGFFKTRITTGPGDATELARGAVAEGAEIVVCVGGDGTLNEVINGLMGEREPRKPELLLGFIPRGTGCDFVRTVTLPKDVDKALENIAGCNFRRIDLGRLVFQDHEGRTSCRYFHNVLSFGLGGEVDDRVNRTTRVFGGLVSFIWATLASILLYNTKQILLKVDDGFQKEVTCWNVAVANGQYHGGGMCVAPGASVDDGLFQVTEIGALSKPEVFWNLPKLYNGRIYEHKKIRKLVGRRIEATSNQRVLLDMDGEQPGQLPVIVEIVPRILPIICG